MSKRGTNLTLREESNGKKHHPKKGYSATNNAKSMLKFRHLQQLATWAVVDSSVPPSLGAFFGNRFAAYGETIDVPTDHSLFPCQRCETLLQPGVNCTVRIEKNRAKLRRQSKKPNNPSQNNVVYNCLFCSHRNLKRGTPRGHLKDICPPKVKLPPKSPFVKPEQTNEIFPPKVSFSSESTFINLELAKEVFSPKTKISSESTLTNPEHTDEIFPPKVSFSSQSTFINLELAKEMFSPTAKISCESTLTNPGHVKETIPPKTNLGSELSTVHSMVLESVDPERPIDVKVDEMASPSIIIPATPRLTLLDAKKRKRKKPGSNKKPSETDVSSASKIDEEKAVSLASKRRRKTWTNLKEISEKGQQVRRNTTNLTIPFFL